MSSNVSTTACPSPFIGEALFPAQGGFIDGRFCSDFLDISCCLPCPQTDWLYSDDFNNITNSANWINVAGLAACVFLLVSYAALPVNKTHRHYLSICLVIGIALMQIAFIIPLGAKPNQCYNAITPNDMRSNIPCALSGVFIVAGGWCGVMWVFMRALALHLQICWQQDLGKAFMYGALAAGWGIPALGLTFALVFSGVSFRFGESCHINHKNSLASFWIPLLIFAAITMIIQFSTFGYCIKVYLQSLSDGGASTDTSGLPSYSGSVRATPSPRQTYKRVRRVLELQWRGIVIVLIIIADVIFFAVVFVFLDDVEAALLKDPTKAASWLLCLIQNSGDKKPCLPLAASLVVNIATVAAVLVMLSINGLWLLLLLGRFSMFVGWFELIRGSKSRKNTEFVSVDVGRLKDPVSYEMLGRNIDRSPEPTLTQITPLSPSAQYSANSGRETPDYFGREARYKSPSRSFSAPKPLQQADGTSGGDSDVQQQVSWATDRPTRPAYIDPLGMNKI
ncbi:G protein-like protein-coupled receptor : GPCR, secretin-like protein [Calycina marina]|uniref:G protein-like protein-coupled receptor: GPCR, secretin-like protein n=1 Tax=Calycina marina TaxID=1763456 RepID=A0A9P7Z4Z5_9HELO|nr:G protein-like protein-coupled receptor : GPCR, secretin-like protein [Calycina marina]